MSYSYWKCQDCFNIVLETQNICQCGSKRDYVIKGSMRLPRDWYCGFCSSHNTQHISMCEICGQHKNFINNNVKVNISTSPTHKFRFIIVFGCGDNEKRSKRVDKAIEVFNNSTAFFRSDVTEYIYTHIIMSGKWGGTRLPQPEAVLMKNDAIQKGIPSQYIITETNSRNTIQNIIFSLKLISDGFSENHFDTELVLVSSAFHIPRINIIASKLISLPWTSVPTEEIITEQQRLNELRLISLL